MLYSIYLVLWITSFVHNGVLESEQQAKELYSSILTAAAISSVALVVIFGKFADVTPSYIVLPFAFLMRSLFAAQVPTLVNPNSGYSAAISVSIVLASTIQVIAVSTLFVRNLPNDIRGAMVGLWHLFANLGGTLFSLVGGIMFDKFGPSSPFLLVSVCDLVICLFAVILGCTGYLKS